LLTPSRFEGYPLNSAYHSDGIDKALQGNNGVGVYASYRNASKPVIGVYRWIPGLQAALLAEIEESEALSAAAQVLTSSVIVTVLAALIAVVIGFVRISQVSAPIGTLTQVATRIAAGDLTQRAVLRERNEIGLLAASFNGMTEQLVTNITVLDQNLQEIDKANRALQVATAKAKEAARVKGEFLANVSHELRTPLNAIIGFSDMLLMGMSGALNQKQNHKVARLKENGSRLLTLINDLLDLTRIEAGRLETVQNAFSPRALVERIAAQMESLADQTKLRFDTTLDTELPPTVLGDEKRTEQVIVNLLSNAFKFTKEGGISLHVYVDHRAETWNIDVTDTGIGIPPHALDLIFEEFRQLDGSYSRAFKGTGLGLAITRNLVRMMNGKINVKSTLGVGSTFSVTIPLVTEEQPIMAREEAVA
jgi:signal transduction histidine kinase